MKRNLHICLKSYLAVRILLLVSMLLFISLDFSPEPDLNQPYFSPVDIDILDNGKQLLITEGTGKQLDIFDVALARIIRTIPIHEQVSGTACSADGGTYFVTCGTGPGHVLVVDAVSGHITKKIPVGHTPVSPVLSKDEKRLFVCNRFDHAVSIIDLKKNRVIKTVQVVREPVAAAITPDGRLLYVANHLPDGKADADYIASKISVLDLEKELVVKTIRLVNGAEGMRGICVSPDGRFVYATHLMARYQVPTNQIERGWINTNALSVISVKDQKLLYTVLMDDIDRGFANPWAVEVSRDGKWLCVSSAGNHELRIIDLPALTGKINRALQNMGEEAEAMHLNAHNDLAFISGVSRRVRLNGLGPRALAIAGSTIYAAEYFSNSLGMINLDPSIQTREVKSIPLDKEKMLTLERQGEIFFNDASLCFQNWQSCASCHSDDGRVDALNWDLLNDGIGNPKNAKSLLLSHVTPPVMAMGVRPDAEAAVRAGIRHIQFAVCPEENAVAIDAYLMSLEPVPSPELVRGKLSKVARKGKILFEREGCLECHPAPLFTDLKQYNLGTGIGLDDGKKFDTPTLVEVWRTSPYLHDGSLETMEELILKHNPARESSIMEGELSEKELKALTAYVRSL